MIRRVFHYWFDEPVNEYRADVAARRVQRERDHRCLNMAAHKLEVYR